MPRFVGSYEVATSRDVQKLQWLEQEEYDFRIRSLRSALWPSAQRSLFRFACSGTVRESIKAPVMRAMAIDAPKPVASSAIWAVLAGASFLGSRDWCRYWPDVPGRKGRSSDDGCTFVGALFVGLPQEPSSPSTQADVGTVRLSYEQQENGVPVTTSVAATVRRFDEAGVRGVRQAGHGCRQRRAGWRVDRRQRGAGA